MRLPSIACVGLKGQAHPLALSSAMHLCIRASQVQRRPQSGRVTLPNPICVQNVKIAPDMK